MSMLKSYFGLGAAAAPSRDHKSTVRALPASWYTSTDMYELERRAIFSRKWLLTTHRARVPETGDWVRYDVAGYQFFIVHDRHGKINAFHNICRHRAFPIVTSDEGNSLMFSCKYHGWSYGLSGNLAKAPGYQDMEGFDKSKNNLLPIHVHIDKNGFVWVNLDAGDKPEIPWSKDFEGVDEQQRFENYNIDDYAFDHTWEMEGEYNWKILADNYNECYHCKGAHPDIPKIADLNSYYVKTKDMHIQHFGNPSPGQIENGFRVASTYFWPNASLNITPHFFFVQRFVPTGCTSSVMRYEVYRNKHSSDANFKVIDDMYKRIMSEDKYLCAHAQRNLNAGVFVNGEMHPEMERGPLYFQKTVREVVMEHYEKEQKAGCEIWPAQQRVPKTAAVSQSDAEFCSAVDCCREKGSGIVDTKPDILATAIAF